MESTDRTSVYKVIGAPGTGKTTRVVGNPELDDHTSLVQQNLEEYDMDEQAIVTYTKAGVEEAQERLDELMDAPQYLIKDRVLTIHANCYRTLDVNQDQVVRWWHKQNFCDMMDMEYGQSDDKGDIMSSDHDEGHAFFQIYGWLKSNMKPYEEWARCPAEFPSDKDFVEVAERWDEFKESGGNDGSTSKLIQFSDMIEGVVEWGQEVLHKDGYPNIFGDNPDDPMETFKQTADIERFNPEKWRGRGPFIDTKVLYVDEVQDLTPLQWAWYLMNKLVCEKVYIGGDDDQTIYGWAGANPDFMLDEEGDFEVLDKTYRIPAEIWETCDGVIQQVDKRQEKDVEPHGDGGAVHTYRSPRPEQVMKHLNEGECMALFRANYQVDNFREKLHEFGIPYRNMSTYDTWSDDVVVIRDALAKLRKGAEKLTGKEVDTLVEYGMRECKHCKGDGCSTCDYEGQESMLADGNGFTADEAAMGDLGGIKTERVRDIFDLSTRYTDNSMNAKTYLDQSDELNYYEKEAIRGCVLEGNEHLDPDRLRIGTIHSSKGKEAETVMVALDSTQQILSNMAEDTRDKPGKRISDAERRVYYVGITRASEKLVLVEGLMDSENTILLNDLLADEGGNDDEWAVEGAMPESV